MYISKKYKSIFCVSALSFIFLVMIIDGLFHSLNKDLGLEDDNLAEEFIEKIIESQTGIQLDLTPNND